MGRGLGHPLAQRGELALEGRALALQRPEGLGLELERLLPLAHLAALLGQAAADLLLRGGATGQLRPDPFVLAAGRTAIGGGGLLLGGGLVGPELGLRPLVLRPGAPTLHVGEPFGRQRQVPIEPTELDPSAGESLGDVGAPAFRGGPRARGLLPPLLRLGDAGASRGQQRAQLTEARLHAGDLLAQPLEQPPRQRQLHRVLLLGELRVPLGLAPLPGETADLRLHLGDEVLHPLEVHGGLLQPALGAVLPVAIEPDARRLLEERAPLVGAVGEEQVDHLRLDHDARVAAEAGAAEQVLDVAEADGRAVEQVVALSRAGEASGDDDLAVGDGEVAVGVVEEEGDFGDVDRAARGRTLEDHVLHLAAAEQPGRLLAQDPAHRVGDVGLAAAVGAHDGGDAVLEGEGDVVGEGLEAGQLQLGELHGRVPVVDRDLEAAGASSPIGMGNPGSSPRTTACRSRDRSLPPAPGSRTGRAPRDRLRHCAPAAAPTPAAPRP